MTCSELLRDFITARRADGLRESTLKGYTRVIGQLITYLGDCDPAEVSLDDLRRFLADYRTGHKPKTVYNAWVAIRSFWRYLSERGYENIALRLTKPRHPSPPVNVPTQEDIRRLLAACEYTAPSQGRRAPFRMRRPTAKRGKALLMLMVDTGMRLGEVAALKVGDVDLETGRVLIRRAKAGKWRTVFISRPVIEALRAYWDERGARPDEPAFTTRTSKGMTGSEIYRRIRNIGKRAGVSIHPHALRHFFATQYLRNRGDAITLKRLLGHSTFSMVERYLQIVDDDLRDAHRRASPLLSVLKEED